MIKKQTNFLMRLKKIMKKFMLKKLSNYSKKMKIYKAANLAKIFIFISL